MNPLKRQHLVVIIWSISIIFGIIAAIVGKMMSTTIGGVMASTRPSTVWALMAIPIITGIIWTAWGIFNHRRSKQNTTQEAILPLNAPISYKMALLLEMMDEDEREALKHDLRRQVLGSGEAYRLQDMLEDDSLSEESSGKRKHG